MSDSLSFLSNTLENLPIGCVILDSNVNIINANSDMFSYFNTHCKDYKGKKFGNVFNCSVVAGTGELCGTLSECDLCDIKNGFECVINKKNQLKEIELSHNFLINHTIVDKWFKVSANIIHVDEIEYVLANILDISETKKLENLLKMNDEKYKLLFENMTQAFALHEIIINENGTPVDYRFININPAFELITDLKNDVIIGRTILEIDPSTDQYWIDVYGEVALSGKATHFERYSEENARYYDILAFCPRIGRFAVIFSDITEKKEMEKKLNYYYYHDQQTDLFNRRYLIEQLPKLDIERNLPITAVIGDINGLKLANDAFGRKAGDQLIRRMSEIIKKSCSSEDIIIKWGGDEVLILLLNSDEQNAEILINTIKKACKKRKTAETSLSISFGYATKNESTDSFDDVLHLAEEMMLKNKAYESAGFRGQTINIILNTLHAKNRREEQHSRRVSQLCMKIGMAMGLSDSEVNKLRVIGLMHDIGKIGIDEEILNKKRNLTQKEWTEIKKHSEIGYRILSSTNETSELAQHVLAHHERLDGKGYPNGVKGDNISTITRILSIADTYDAITSDRTYRGKLKKEQAIEELLKNTGTQFDSSIVDVFINKVLATDEINADE